MCSSDLAFGGQIYTSANSGLSWTARDSNRDWRTVASSADGTKLVAVVQGGEIYTSTEERITSSTVGTAGGLTGAAGSTVQLQYVGGGQFIILSTLGTLSVQ